MTILAHVPVALGRMSQGFGAKPQPNAAQPAQQQKGAGSRDLRATDVEMLRVLVSAALGLFVTSALPLRAPARILSSCNNKPWRGCPEEGARLGEKLAGFSEAMAMYDGSTSGKSGSAFARAGENGLDRAASKVFATSVAATMARLQLYQNDATKGGGDDEEEAAQGYLGRALFKLLAILLELVLGLFVFGRVIPRCSSSAKGAAWRSSVVGYLLIWGDVARVAAETSVRGSDYTITKSSKIKTNESPSSAVQSLEQRRVLSGYVMTNSNIHTARDAWLADASAAESTYGHISTWDTSGVTDMEKLFCADYDATYRPLCNSAAASFNEDISSWDTSGVESMDSMFKNSAFNQDISAWDTSKATAMNCMFCHASAFDQDLGWCVEKDDMDGPSSLVASSKCEATSCGILPSAAQKCGGGPMSDFGIEAAVKAWLLDATAAESEYGHISTWETGAVTDMSYLFCASTGHAASMCNTAAASFNEDISAWDTSGVRHMNAMFYSASAFNRDIGN